MEMYSEEGTIEIGSNVLVELAENEDMVSGAVGRFLRRLYHTCGARKIMIWRVTSTASAVWSMTGGMAYPSNKQAYSVMIAHAERQSAAAPPPIPCGAVMFVNNEEREIIEERAYKVVKHKSASLLMGRAEGMDISMVDMGATE